MPFARRTRPAAPDAEASASSAEASASRPQAPAWRTALSTPAVSALVEAITGRQTDPAEASWLLQVEPAQVGAEQAEPTRDAAWTEEVEAEAPAPAAPSVRPQGILGEVHDDHRQHGAAMSMDLSAQQQADLAFVRSTYEAQKHRYEAVSAKTGVPPMLIAAIHYRESSMDFGTYLHQGDPLGRPAVNHPANIPVFHEWEKAAVHALLSKQGVRDAAGLTADTRDHAAIATYAEAYNGLGYHYRGDESPYVYAGSDAYTGGKFVADGQYDPNAFDRRLGVMPILHALGGVDRRPEIGR